MGASTDSRPEASCEVVESGNEMRIKLSGDLTARSISGVWKQCVHRIKSAKKRSVIIDAESVGTCDGAGIGLSFLFSASLVHFRQLTCPPESSPGSYDRI